MTKGLRSAALTVHGLLPVDREWLLEQLPEPQRLALGGHLTELAELGIPADRALLEEAMKTGGQDRQWLIAEPDFRMCHASAEDIFSLLVEEPDQLIALVLKIGPWPWRDSLLERFGVERRGRVICALREVEPKAGLSNVLLAELGTRLMHLPPRPADVVPPEKNIGPLRLRGWRNLLPTGGKLWRR